MMDYLPGALIIGVGATVAMDLWGAVGWPGCRADAFGMRRKSHHALRLRRWTLCCWLDCEPHGCGL